MSVPVRSIQKLLEEVMRTAGEDRLRVVEANKEILRSEAAASVALQTIAVYQKLVNRLEKGLAVVRAAQQAEDSGESGEDVTDEGQGEQS